MRTVALRCARRDSEVAKAVRALEADRLKFVEHLYAADDDDYFAADEEEVQGDAGGADGDDAPPPDILNMSMMPRDMQDMYNKLLAAKEADDGDTKDMSQLIEEQAAKQEDPDPLPLSLPEPEQEPAPEPQPEKLERPQEPPHEARQVSNTRASCRRAPSPPVRSSCWRCRLCAVSARRLAIPSAACPSAAPASL